jgi:hypothetical protein
MLLSDGTEEDIALWRRWLRKTPCVRLGFKNRNFRSECLLSSALTRGSSCSSSAGLSILAALLARLLPETTDQAEQQSTCVNGATSAAAYR